MAKERRTQIKKSPSVVDHFHNMIISKQFKNIYNSITNKLDYELAPTGCRLATARRDFAW